MKETAVKGLELPLLAGAAPRRRPEPLPERGPRRGHRRLPGEAAAALDGALSGQVAIAGRCRSTPNSTAGHSTTAMISDRISESPATLL